MAQRPPIRVIGALALLAGLGWHVHARSQPDAELGAADRALLSVTGPIQNTLGDALGSVAGVFDGYVALVGTAAENEDLRHQVAEAEAAAAELAEVRRENDRLRALAGLRSRVPGQAVAASIIGRGTSPRFQTLRIDRGTDDGVQTGMAVVVPGGAVGQILRTSAGYADILLLSDGLSAAGAVLEESRLRGVVLGDGSDDLRLGFVRRRDQGAVEEGATLVTSGEDGVFPEGVSLGTVAAVETPNSGLFLEIDVDPAVDPDRLDEVLVVLNHGVGPFHADPELLPPQEPSSDVGGPSAMGLLVGPPQP